MPTIQEIVDRRRILEQAKKGIRQERIQQVKQRVQKTIKNIRQARYSSVQGKPTRTTQSAFLRFFGQRQAVKGKGQKSVGRPRSVFKHISPITGKPIPAQIYNKEMRFIRRRQSDIATQRLLAIQQQMAKQGINPQQAQQIQMARQMPTQQVITRPMPSNQVQQPPIPQSMPRSIWNRAPPQPDTDWGLFGRRVVTRGTVEAMWN